MSQEEFQDLFKKYREDRCTREEKKIIDDWYASISASGKPFTDPRDEQFLKEQSWKAVDRHITLNERSRSAPARSGGIFWSTFGVAATVLLLAIAGWYLTGRASLKPLLKKVSLQTEPVQKSVFNEGDAVIEYILPDQSRIQLNPGSKISFSEDFSGSKREIYLEGEAFFEVARDVTRPFLVYTDELTTEVLGTSFLIRAYKKAKQIVVTVKTGKVSVYTHTGNSQGLDESQREIILSPNQEAVYHPGEHVTLRKLVSKPQIILPTPTLKNTYTNAPVIEILSSLEENYGIDIQYNEDVLSNCTLTSDLSEEGFYAQIKIICNALGAEYEIEQTAVVIKATGCSGY